MTDTKKQFQITCLSCTGSRRVVDETDDFLTAKELKRTYAWSGCAMVDIVNDGMTTRASESDKRLKGHSGGNFAI